MKLKEKGSIFNMGDTSLRVKEIVPIYREVLHVLRDHMEYQPIWVRNKPAQAQYYRDLLNHFADLDDSGVANFLNTFNRNEENELDKRGRTVTNAPLKVGLISPDRHISDVGLKYLDNKMNRADSVENWLGLTIDNLLYMRQLLKLRIYDQEGECYFYNFRFALAFLSKYRRVHTSDFLWILESIQPGSTQSELDRILSAYQDVYDNNKTFDEYKDDIFLAKKTDKSSINFVKQMFNQRDFSDINVKRAFPNRKNSETSKTYGEFVEAIIRFRENPNYRNLIPLVNLSEKNTVKKAFGGDNKIFQYKQGDSPEVFLEKNQEHTLLTGDYLQIYTAFVWSKHNDLVSEYSDMCRRIFSLSGLIKFDKGLTELAHYWLIPKIIKCLDDRFIITGEGDYESYELNKQSDFYQDLTLIDILGLTVEDINFLELELQKEFKLEKVSDIKNKIDDDIENSFREFVEKEFPREKVVEILELISKRDYANKELDKSIQDLVTDSTFVPTIFEYILAIAWYYISNRDIKLKQSMQLTLSADYLPLSHATGNKGDIEVEYNDKMLLLEATLMDIHTQKRGELEPVIRHSINLALATPKPLKTIFVANQVDVNVANIFRSMAFVELQGTQGNKGKVEGVSIFALTVPEVIDILKNEEIDYNRIERAIDCNYSKEPIFVREGWREKIVAQIHKPPLISFRNTLRE